MPLAIALDVQKGMMNGRDFVEFAGDPAAGKFVEHIALRGLAFRHGQFILPDKGQSDGQAAASSKAVWAGQIMS